MSNDTRPPDTLPPPSGSMPTIPPDAPSTEELPPIPRGQAQAALSAALDDLVRSYRLLEAVALAVGRQLDAEAER